MNCGKCGKPIQSYLVVYNELEPYTPEYWCLACVWRKGSDQILEEDKPEYTSQLQKEAEEKEDDEDLFDLEDLEGDFDDPALNVAAVEDSISKYGDVTKLKYTGAYHEGWKPLDIDIPKTIPATDGDMSGSGRPDKIEMSGSNDGVEIKAYDDYGNETYSWNPFKSPVKGANHCSDLDCNCHELNPPCNCDPNPNNAKVRVDRDWRDNIKKFNYVIDTEQVKNIIPGKMYFSDDYDIINKWFESSEKGNEDPT